MPSQDQTVQTSSIWGTSYKSLADNLKSFAFHVWPLIYKLSFNTTRNTTRLVTSANNVFKKNVIT